MHCEALRTRATGQPASTRPSAAEPATADASSAAIGGARDTCHQLPHIRSQDAEQPPGKCLDKRSKACRKTYSYLCRKLRLACPHDRQRSRTVAQQRTWAAWLRFKSSVSEK